jgi:hypothetical protein
MNFDDVQIGQMFLYKEIYTEGWIVTGKTDSHIDTIYMLNYGGEIQNTSVRYNRRQWAQNDYFNAYVTALRKAGYDIKVESVNSKDPTAGANYD